MEVFLRFYINYQQNDWSEWLSFAEFTYNNRKHSATGFSPFELTNGSHPIRSWEIDTTESANQTVEEFLAKGKIRLIHATSALEKAREAMKTAYDQHTKESRNYQPGDLIWLDARNIPTTRPMKKLEPKKYGPFRILQKIGRAAYKVKLPPGWRIHNVFNEILLSPFQPPKFPGQRQYTFPPPDIINDEDEFEVEEIKTHRERNGNREYLVAWRGYSEEENTWQPEKDLAHAQQLLRKYKKSHQL